MQRQNSSKEKFCRSSRHFVEVVEKLCNFGPVLYTWPGSSHVVLFIIKTVFECPCPSAGAYNYYFQD